MTAPSNHASIFKQEKGCERSTSLITSVCRRIYLDVIGDIDGWRRYSIKPLEPFFSITSDTEIPLSLTDQCRSCIRNAIV
jgi:hypothetical protein